MKKLLIVTAVAAALGVSSNVLAKGTPYIEGALGYTLQKISGDEAPGLDKNHFGGRISAGYLFDVSPMTQVGGEVGYGWYGKVKTTAGNVSMNGFDVTGVANFKLQPRLDFFAKAGVARLKYGKSGSDFSDSENKWAPLLGLGVGYELMPNVEGKLGYNYFFKKNDITLHNLYLGLAYNF